MTSSRDIELDGLRGIAISLVIAWHYVFVIVPENAAIGRFLRDLGSLAWSGVDLFFVLSGYLIARILITHVRTRRDYGVFYVRRVCRIIPLFYLLLFCFVAFKTLGISPLSTQAWLYNGTTPLWTYFLFVQNFPMSGREFEGNFLAITWSLAVEEQFYLMLPVLLHIFKVKRIPIICGFGIVLAFLLRCESPYQFQVLFPLRADAPLVGVLVAYIEHTGHLNLRRTFLSVMVVSGIAASLAVLLYFNRFGSDYRFSYLSLAISYGFILVALRARLLPAFEQFLRSRWLVRLGLLS